MTGFPPWLARKPTTTLNQHVQTIAIRQRLRRRFYVEITRHIPALRLPASFNTSESNVYHRPLRAR